MSLRETENTVELTEKLNEATKYIKQQWNEETIPDVAIVLGSGLGEFAKRFKSSLVIPYSEIPNMVKTTVSGHSGNLVLGTFENGKQVIAFAGRVHAYEGIRMFEVTFLARLAHALGCKIFIATNAAGGALAEMQPGNAMIITDCVNILKRNPLQEVYCDERLCPKSVSGTQIFSQRIVDMANTTAKTIEGFGLLEGTYACFPGPSYETPSEIRGGVATGVGAFGMSTVPECIVAHSLGMEVFALSLCTNLAAGISSIPLSHEEVKETADKSGPLLMAFMESLLSQLEAVELHETVALPTSDSPAKTLNQNVKRATAEEIAEAVAYIHERVPGVKKYPVAAHLTARESSKFIDVVYKQKCTFSLSELPNYPNVCGGGGEMVIGQVGDNGFITVVPSKEMGFLPPEACFLVQLFKELSVATLLFAAVGATYKSYHDKMYAISDACDITTMHCTISPSASINTQLELFNESQSLLGYKKLSSGSYFQFTGPAYPPPAEQEFAKISKADLLGITNLQIVFAARSAGIGVIGLAGATYTLPNFQEVENAGEIFTSLNDTLARFYLSGIPCDPKPQVLEEPVTPFQLSYELRDPSQGNPEVINPMIKTLDKIGAERAFIVYDPFFDFVASKLSNMEPIDLGDSGDFCPIYTGKYEGHTVLLVHQNRYYYQGFSFSETYSSIRAVSGCVLKNVAIIAPFCSVVEDDSIKVGSIVQVKDHVNLSGRSPLFGEQIEGWGKRFPDMSSVWTSFSGKDPVTPVTVGIVIGPIVSSELQANYYRSISTNVLSCSVGWDALVLKHMRPEIALTGFGVVTSTQSGTPREPTNAEDKREALQQLMQNWITQ